MYTGRTIDDLMEMVSQAEERAFSQMQLSLKKSVQNVTGFNTHIYAVDTQVHFAGAA